MREGRHSFRSVPASVQLVAVLLILCGSLRSAEAAAYYSLNMNSQTTVSSPEVILQNGTAGTSTIYTNSTSAMVSVDALNWLAGWDNRVKITVNSSDIDEELLDFPVLVYLSNSSSGENDADVSFIFDELGNNRKKIAVTTSDATTQCYVEIERWDDSSEKAWLWVKIPNISNTTDTTLYLYYNKDKADNTAYIDDTASGNSTKVWDSNFKTVLHLNQSPSGLSDDIKDSTPYANHGTSEGSMNSTDLVDTVIGKGLEFDEIDDLIRVPNSTSLSFNKSSGTCELWINWANATDGDHQIVMASSNRFTPGANDGFEWASQGDGDHFFYPWGGDGNNYNLGPNPFTNGVWHHLAVTYLYTTREVEIYIDAVNMSFTTENVPTYWTQLANASDWLWGGNPDRPTRYFDGIFDEIRIHSETKSDAWIKASYESGRDDLADFGSEERNMEDSVDNNTSDVGSPNDIGTHSNFTAQQYGPDSICDTLTEEDTLGSWGNYSSELLVNPGAEFGNTTGWTATGPNTADFAAGYDCPSGSAGPHIGSYAFYWNSPSSSSDWAYQEADLSPWLSEIQSGDAQILAKGWLVCSEYHDPPWDIVRMRVVFYDNSSLEISSDTYDTGELGNLTAWTEFGIENYTMPTNAVKMRMWFQTYESGWDAGNADDFTVKVRVFRNYELDLEVQWTEVDFSEENEELCIYGGAMDAENLRVDVRNGSTWETLFNDLSSGWNNISVSSYLTSSNFTIRFKGGNETGDTAQDSWNIDAALLHIWTTDAMTHDYVLRINNTDTDSWQIRLKEASDSAIERLQNCTICFHNSSDGTSNQIVIESGGYAQDVGPWYDLGSFQTIYIAMTVGAKSTGTSYVRTYLEIRVPGTTVSLQYVILFRIT